MVIECRKQKLLVQLILSVFKDLLHLLLTNYSLFVIFLVDKLGKNIFPACIEPQEMGQLLFNTRASY